MPIEIKELLIKAVVEDSASTSAASSQAAEPGGGQEDIIEACVEKILEILNEKQER